MMPSRWTRKALAWSLLAAAPVSAAYDANGVALGASEEAIRKGFPGAHCKALEWTSRAADRRCDEAKAVVGGVNGRITFYLRQGKVQAFDLRFDGKDAPRMAQFLKTRYGTPSAEDRGEVQAPRGKPPREIYKVRWEKGGERAVMTSAAERRRASLTVSRGDFDEEIYRVR